MKDERNVRRRRAAGRSWKPVAIILAAILMVLSLPIGFTSASADVIDLTTPCTLTVSPGSVDLAEDLAQANVVIDLYRVADAIPVSGVDTYDWQMTAPFQSITIEKGIDSDGWKSAAQSAAEIVLGKAPENETDWDPSETVAKIPAELVYSGKAANAPIDVKAGLYLIIAHGSDVKNYAAVSASGSTAANAGDGSTAAAAGTVTVANSETYAYQFSPELISIPTKDADEAGVINTANSGNWIYDPAVTLKPSRVIRSGSLEITKTLLRYADREKTTDGETRKITDPATFVFEVTIYKSDAENAPVVKHDFVSIVFDGADSGTARINNLPVGSYVVVNEVYSSRVYDRDGEPEYSNEDQLIPADGNLTLGVSFEDDYNGKNPGGGSVTNRFEFEKNNGWVWSQVADDTDASIAKPIQTRQNQ